MDKYLKNTILAILLVLFTTILFISNLFVYPISCENEDYILSIEANNSASHIGEELSKNSCINKNLFKIAIYLSFNQSNIKPGLYSLKGIRTYRDLIKLITSISDERIRFTIYEGSTINELALGLSEKLNIDKDDFIELCYNKNFIKTLGITYDVNSLEGFLYPDTYIFLDTYTEKDILRILTKRFMDIINTKIHPILNLTELNLVEIITLASIIQGEAMIVNEMPLISTVYHNRMKKNMKLEADPTVLYYMKNDDLDYFIENLGNKKSTKIFRKYKKMDNLYNTYMHKGLPVGPINNPGLSALKASIMPLDTNKVFLYFVADGTGGHIFTENLKDHKIAIKKVRSGH